MGLFYDLMRPGPLGISALAYTLTAFAVGSLLVAVLTVRRTLAALVVFVASILGTLLFAVISERLETQRRLDLSDVQLHVLNSEVTLEGTVRHKGDRRLIEDIADIDGVHHVQNNLRVREGRGWTFF